MPVDPVVEILCPKDAAILWQIKIYKNDKGKFTPCVRAGSWTVVMDSCGGLIEAKTKAFQQKAAMLAELEDLIDA